MEMGAVDKMKRKRRVNHRRASKGKHIQPWQGMEKLFSNKAKYGTKACPTRALGRGCLEILFLTEYAVASLWESVLNCYFMFV
jgi:hypothetical protein